MNNKMQAPSAYNICDSLPQKRSLKSLGPIRATVREVKDSHAKTSHNFSICWIRGGLKTSNDTALCVCFLGCANISKVIKST